MSEELKACPFCEKNDNLDKLYVGDKTALVKCKQHGITMTYTAWQSRPLEDALQEQLKLSYAENKYILDQRDELQKKLEIAVEALRRIEYYANSDFLHTEISREALKKLEE